MVTVSVLQLQWIVAISMTSMRCLNHSLFSGLWARVWLQETGYSSHRTHGSIRNSSSHPSPLDYCQLMQYVVYIEHTERWHSLSSGENAQVSLSAMSAPLLGKLFIIRELLHSQIYTMTKISTYMYYIRWDSISTNGRMTYACTCTYVLKYLAFAEGEVHSSRRCRRADLACSTPGLHPTAGVAAIAGCNCLAAVGLVLAVGTDLVVPPSPPWWSGTRRNRIDGTVRSALQTWPRLSEIIFASLGTWSYPRYEILNNALFITYNWIKACHSIIDNTLFHDAYMGNLE